MHLRFYRSCTTPSGIKYLGNQVSNFCIHSETANCLFIYIFDGINPLGSCRVQCRALPTISKKLSIHSGHYTASLNHCKKNYIATITQLRSLELLIKTPLLHILYYINWLTHDFFGLEQEGGSLIAPMALAHPLHPIDNMSRNKCRNLWVGRCVSFWRPWFPSRSYVLPYTHTHTHIYIYIYI